MENYFIAEHQASLQSERRISQFMSQVYCWMMLGLMTSGGIAYYLFNSPFLSRAIVESDVLFTGLLIVQISCVFAFAWIQKRCRPSIAIFLYSFYTVLSGITLSVIFFAYTQQDIFLAFSITAASFFGLSMFGLITKRDLTSIGTFCIMGLWGLIITMFAAFFVPELRSNTIQLTTAAIGVLVFAGLTAYDSQKIKTKYTEINSSQTVSAISGALMLYLDFLNLFLLLLRLLGGRR